MPKYEIDWPGGQAGEVRDFRLPDRTVLRVVAGSPLVVELAAGVAASLARKVRVKELKPKAKTTPDVTGETEV